MRPTLLPANGGEGTEWVNCFTIVMDVRIPELDQWYCFYQTNWSNSNDGDWFVNPDGQVGVGDTGYSFETVVPEEWYRLAISAHLGQHYDYYLDGQLLHIGGPLLALSGQRCQSGTLLRRRER